MSGTELKATQINSNRISVSNKNLENSIKNFCYHEMKKMALDVLGTKIDGHYLLGLLWRDRPV